MARGRDLVDRHAGIQSSVAALLLGLRDNLARLGGAERRRL